MSILRNIAKKAITAVAIFTVKRVASKVTEKLANAAVRSKVK